MLLELDEKVLKPGSPIIISHEKAVRDSDIVPLVKKVRAALLVAMDNRFYNRFAFTPEEKKRGSGAPADGCNLEMVTVMHPAYKKLSCLNNVIARRNDEVSGYKEQQFKQKIYEKIMALAKTVADATCMTLRFELTDVEPEPFDHLADDFDLADTFSESLSIASRSNIDTYGLVRQNFDRYIVTELNNGFNKVERNLPK